jgi:hypothetical protein
MPTGMGKSLIYQLPVLASGSVRQKIAAVCTENQVLRSPQGLIDRVRELNFNAAKNVAKELPFPEPFTSRSLGID